MTVNRDKFKISLPVINAISFMDYLLMCHFRRVLEEVDNFADVLDKEETPLPRRFGHVACITRLAVGKKIECQHLP